MILVRVLVLRKADKTVRFTTGLEEYQKRSFLVQLVVGESPSCEFRRQKIEVPRPLERGASYLADPAFFR